MTREETLKVLVEELLARPSLRAAFEEDEAVLAAPVTMLAEMVIPGEAHHQNGTRWRMNGQPCRVWDVLRSIADVMEHG